MIPLAPFGRTGHMSSRLIFGAAALGAMSQERADATLALAHNAGINHIDVAASYGAAEDRLAPWLVTHRDEVFLATKTAERTGAGARAELERSLQRMGVDHVDLIQLHNLVEPDEWATAHGPRGAVEALMAARDEGLVLHVGITGHGLRIANMHLQSLERADFDSVLFPFNFSLMSLHSYRRDVERLFAICAQRNVAVQTIKAIARRRWTDGSTQHFSWYEPLSEPEAIAHAVRWVLSHPQVFLNTTSDARLLPHVFAAAVGDVVAPTDSEMASDIKRHDVTPLFDGALLERI